ncbi:ABC-2 family transporter protein [Clostridium sp. YIM B02515]|uniref:ABC-2 family transporter protein n=1 Tax=Clostridium rhizosphaerae TaxID=2803861 RepID=A0ABS1TDH8_9CLOT|nr:ABC-2 family transporter protein [Clostridium rhizosphaerae]MBL4936038.1 ABC-2 family transporter protein [Clostridium rhizosphaerae]
MLKKYTRLYMKFLAQYLKSLMEYKADFLIGLLGFVVVQATGIAFLYLVFQRIPSLNGWSFNEILFIYGFAQLPRGLDHLFTDNLWLLAGRIIVRGDFDRYLLRPINPLFHLLAERFQPDALGELIVGIALVIASVPKINITFTFGNILAFILVVICGSVIYTSIKLFFASFAFWLKFSQSILFMNYMLADFTKYPITIYSKWIRVILTFIIPFAFTAYFPAGYFVGKVSMSVAVGGTFLAAVISFAVAYTTWIFGIRAYESAGA